MGVISVSNLGDDLLIASDATESLVVFVDSSAGGEDFIVSIWRCPGKRWGTVQLKPVAVAGLMAGLGFVSVKRYQWSQRVEVVDDLSVRHAFVCGIQDESFREMYRSVAESQQHNV